MALLKVLMLEGIAAPIRTELFQLWPFSSSLHLFDLSHLVIADRFGPQNLDILQ